MTFTVGQRVTWLHEPRGGYGYILPVDGIVLSVGPKRVTIEVTTKDGRKVKRHVSPDKLRLKNDETTASL